jgi:flagellar hook protein FlgE
MLQSFYTAITGLNGNQQWLNVISDNIANVNTIGFKSERVTFEDVIAHSLTTFANNTSKNIEIGGGSFVALTTKDFSQGSFMNTNSPTDLALDGEGFFMIKDNQGTVYYTRAGQFRLNADGDLVNVDGMKLQGWMLDDNGNIIGALDKINIPYAVPPTKTTKINFVEPTNLDSRSNVPSKDFDRTDSTTFNYVNSMTIYDSLGNPHTLSFYFVKKGADTWDVHVYKDNDSTEVEKQTLQFDTNGNLTSPTSFTLDLSFQNGAASPQSITVDVSKIKQVASDFTFYANQDGSAKGDLIGVSVAEDGTIKGMYSNGNVKNIARLAVATFKDKEMLVRKGSNLYLSNTPQTSALIITPGGALSKVRSGFLELSNVDVSREFINLITAQRAYQANARVITTDDQILQEAMNMKR